MKRAPKSKMASLYHFWTSDQQQNMNEFIRNQDEVITLSDSPLEHINATPFSVFGSQHSSGGNVSKWAPLLRRSTTSDPSPPSKSVPTPLRHISPASETELEKAGFDPREGSTIRYPANEHYRQYEMDIVKLCTAENSAVCLPLAISADHICAVVVMNFLRWFPRSRAIFCCSSLEAAHLFEERCKAIGISLEEVFIVDTFKTFKKAEEHRVGRLVVTTPQALEKIIESNSSFVCDIRCIILSLDAYEGSRLTKCRNIVGVLTVKGILFRVILVTPSVPSTSRKLKPLRNRQQIITSLIISQWIEPSALDPSFRSSAVPLEISVDYYSTTDGTSELVSFTEKWIERVVIHLEKLNTLIPLPSTKPQELFTIDWTPIISKAKLCTGETAQMVMSCIFLLEATRNIVIHGPRVFYLYCADSFRKASRDSNDGNIELTVLSDTVLSAIYGKIQTKYSYNNDAPFEISFNNQSFTSHPKFSRLRSVLEKCSFPVRCLILCENEHLSRVVCESLHTPQLRNAIIRVLPNIAPPEHRDCHRTLAQCSELLNRSNESVILVVDIDIPNFVNVVDTICSSRLQVVVSMDRRSILTLTTYTGMHIAILHADCEKLRPTDGRETTGAEKMALTRNLLSGKTGIIAKYNFSFEFSRLQLPSSKMELVQYIPVTLCSALDMKVVSCSRRYGFELTSAELNEFCDRLSALPVVDRGSYDRNSRLVFLSSCYDISKMLLNGSFGNVPSSTLRKRLMDCLNGNDFIKKRKKRRYNYTEELVDKKRIEFYGQMIEKLNELLTI